MFPSMWTTSDPRLQTQTSTIGRPWFLFPKAPGLIETSSFLAALNYNYNKMDKSFGRERTNWATGASKV